MTTINIEEKLNQLKQELKQMKSSNHYTPEYLKELLEKKFNAVKEPLHTSYKEELETTESRLSELETAVKQIIPQKYDIEEMLRRQQLDLEVSFMDDNTLKEHTLKTLLNDHENYDELFLQKELKNRNLEKVIDEVQATRERRLADNSEYETLHNRMNKLKVFIGFSDEISYEDDNGKIHYVSKEKIESEVL